MWGNVHRQQAVPVELRCHPSHQDPRRTAPAREEDDEGEHLPHSERRAAVEAVHDDRFVKPVGGRHARVAPGLHVIEHCADDDEVGHQGERGSDAAEELDAACEDVGKKGLVCAVSRTRQNWPSSLREL